MLIRQEHLQSSSLYVPSLLLAGGKYDVTRLTTQEAWFLPQGWSYSSEPNFTAYCLVRQLKVEPCCPDAVWLVAGNTHSSNDGKLCLEHSSVTFRCGCYWEHPIDRQACCCSLVWRVPELLDTVQKTIPVWWRVSVGSLRMSLATLEPLWGVQPLASTWTKSLCAHVTWRCFYKS
jgi:hypothetical protein